MSYTRGFLEEEEKIIRWNAGTMPPEHDSIFKKFYGTKKWKSVMFRTISSEVLVTIDVRGARLVSVAHTTDGVWRSKFLDVNPDWKVVAWAALPRAYER